MVIPLQQTVDVMEISNLTLDSIKRYYKVLAKKGSVGTPDLYKLLVLSFIEDLLMEDCYTTLTEEEYSFVLGVINCISKNTCLVQYTQVSLHTEPIRHFLFNIPIEITEGNVIKLSESDVVRLLNN